MAYELVAKLRLKDEMSAKIEKATHSIKKMTNISDKANVGFRKLEQSAKTSAAIIKRDFKKAYEDAKPTSLLPAIGGAGKAIMAAGSAGAGAMGLALKTTAEFERAMSEVGAISGATGKDLADMEKAARAAGAATSKSAKESADALKYMSLAGWDAKTSMEALMPVLRLSEAGNLDLGRTSDLVTDSMASLGLTVQQLPVYLDQVAQTSRKANTDIDGLMEAMIIAGGTFRSYNVPLEEANALLGILANRGTKGTEAGTSLNSIMVNLTSGMGMAGDAMEMLGLSAYDSKGKFKGMANILKELREKTAGMSEEQRNTYLAMIGGKTQLDTLQKLLAGVGNEYDDLKGKIKNSDGALNDMALTMQDNVIGSLTALKSAIEEAMISVGETFKGDIQKAVQFLNKLVTAFNNLPKGTKKAISMFLAIGTVLAFILGPILMFVSMAASLAANFTALSTAVVGLIGPVGAIIAAIAAVIGIGVLLYKNWDKITNFMGGTVNLIKGSIVSAVKTVWPVIAGIGRVVLATGKVFWSVGKRILKVVWEVIKVLMIPSKIVFSNIIKVVSWAGSKLKPVFTFIAGEVNKVVVWLNRLSNTIDNLSLKDIAVSAISGIKDGAISVGKFIVGIISKGIDKIKTKISGVKETLSSIFKKTPDIFSNLPGKAKKGLKSLTAAMRSWRDKHWNEIKNDFKTGKDAVINMFTSLPEQIGSIFTAIKGKAINVISDTITKIKGLPSVIRDKFIEVGRAILSFVTSIPSKIGTAFVNIRDNVLSTITELPSKIKGAFSGMTAGISEWFKGLFAGEKAVKTVNSGIKKNKKEVVDTLGKVIVDASIAAVTFAGVALIATGREIIVRVGSGISKATPFIGNKLGELKKTVVAAMDGVKTGFLGKLGELKAGAVSIINSIIGAFNGMIRSLNSLSFTVPDWIPSKKFAGKKFSLNIPSIPNISGHYHGLDYVPYDGYVARLHKGERVQTAQEAKETRQGGNRFGSIGDINFNIENMNVRKESDIDAIADALFLKIYEAKEAGA